MNLKQFRALLKGDLVRVDVPSMGHNPNDEEITLDAGAWAVVDMVHDYSPPQNRAVDLIVGCGDDQVVNTWDEGDFEHYGAELPLVLLLKGPSSVPGKATRLPNREKDRR